MKRIVIVGATSGMGLDVARLALRAGWRVGAAGRRTDRLEALRAEAPEQVEIRQMDVTDPAAPEQLATLIGRLGGMDVYLHSSGIGTRNEALDNRLITIRLGDFNATGTALVGELKHI